MTVFAETKVSQFPFNREVVTVSIDATIQEGLQILNDNNISSLPVIEDGKAVAMFDYPQVIRFMLNVLDDIQKSISEPKLYKAFEDSEQWRSATIRNIVDLATPTHVLNADSDLLEAVKLLGSGNHRILVGDGDKLSMILSQSAVVQHISERTDQSPVFKKTIADSGVGLKDVYSVTTKDQTIEAFRMMAKHNVTAVVIVDLKGVCVGVVTSSDIRVMLKHSCTRLLMEHPMDFMTQVRSLQIEYTFVPVATINQKSTIEVATKKLAATKMHRLFVVDDDHKPVGVISVRDILRLVA